MSALGRTLSEAYHRLNSFTSEVRRNIEAEKLTVITGKRCAYRSRDEIETRLAHAEAIINPTRATNVMQDGALRMTQRVHKEMRLNRYAPRLSENRPQPRFEQVRCADRSALERDA